MNYILTIDIELMDPACGVKEMNILKRWKEEGKINLVDAAPAKVVKEAEYNWPGAPPREESEKKSTWGRRNRTEIMKKSGKADFKSIASVLFPYKDQLKLNVNQINSVVHLIKHHSTNNHIFVTRNAGDFINEGRREILSSRFGIQIKTPEETVRMLRGENGWDEGVTEKPDPPSKKKKKAQTVSKGPG